MYKIIMRLTTMDSVATKQTLHENLQALATFTATVQGDIDKIHEEFNKNYSQLISHSATVNDPIQIIFDAYEAVPCYNFKRYIEDQHNNYLDGKLAGITHKALRKMAKSKFDYLVNKKKWGAQSPDDDKIAAMAAEIKNLKGQLKLNPQLGIAVRRRARQRTRKTPPTRKPRKRTKHGRRSHLKMANPRKRNMVISPSVGGSTTWRGLSTSQPMTANLARKGRRNRNPLLARTP
jgi:hypothetical protein